MSIIASDESNIHSGFYQEDRRTWCLRELTKGESIFLFPTSHVNSASSGATEAVELFAHQSEMELMPHDHLSSPTWLIPFSPLLPPWSWSFSLVLALALCAHPLGLSMLPCLTQRLFCPSTVFSSVHVLIHANPMIAGAWGDRQGHINSCYR